MYTAQDRMAIVEEVPFWWHTINFGDGVFSPGHKNQHAQGIVSTALPTDLADRTVLDVGCWDGRYSFEAEERGAAEVLAIDDGWQKEFVRRRYGEEIDPAQGIRTARKVLDSTVRFEPIGLSELAGSGKEFDVTFYLGMVSRQVNPVQSLRVLHELTGETAIIESETLRQRNSKPRYKLYNHGEGGKSGNLYVPNVAALLDWCRQAGFQRTEMLRRYKLGSRTIVQAWK